jgi:hypothetical protein
MFLNCTYTEHHTIDSDHVKNNLFMNTQVHSTCGEIALAFTKKCDIFTNPVFVDEIFALLDGKVLGTPIHCLPVCIFSARKYYAMDKVA